MSNVPLADRISQYGLTEVSSPPNPLVDVVFVHGLNGHPYNTWATTKPPIFWPADLLPSALDEQRCRLLVYGYDANVTAFTDGTSKDRIHNHAEHLASRLVANRSLKKALERPIIFVCHSLGGLVVKRCLIHSRNSRHSHTERTRSIYVSTYGVLFLGTPHNGSDLAKWGTLLERISSAVLPKKFFDSSPQLVQALKTNNETLQNINRLFIEIIGRFRIYFFHESKPMDLKGTREFVVDEDSAAPVIEGVERMGIERDHSHMCKFESENAPGYDVVAEAVQRYATDAPSLIGVRWEEERRIRDFERQEAAKELLRDHTNASGYLNPSNDSAQPSSHSPSMGSSTNSLKETALQVSEISVGPRVVTPLGFRPNSVFVGFEHELDQLHTKLRNKKRRELGTCSVIVWGDVGSGKTHLVRQYFYQHRSEYPEGTFWVDCKTRESILNAFWDIGISVSLKNEGRTGTPPSYDNFIDTVRKRLESLEGWLLVFDGISFESDEELDKFIRFLPDRSGNNIIFTSVDRTLAKRQRLFDPSAVRVKALSIPEACDLLFRNLSIRKPSETQQAKAVDLVKDYQCLPLAIHAASHAMIEKGKALERYSRGISDTRLIHPFLEILSALREKQHLEAINLVVILSFYNHYVPVALVQYGYKGLRSLNVDIMSPKHPGSTQKNLDSTISILMRCGLLERTLQAYPRSNSGQASPEESRGPRRAANGDLPTNTVAQSVDVAPRTQVAEESSGLDLVLARLQSETDQSSTSSHTSTIDVLRMHTVVQNAIRDDLKDRSSRDNNEFWWWLGTSVRLLTHSFEIASGRMRKSSGHGLVRDYREYKMQARRLFSFFPKSRANASPGMYASRHELHSLIRLLRREIHNQSPSQSSDSSHTRFQGSIFERSSSTSEGDPETPTSDQLTRAITWTVEPDRPPSQSPTSIYNQGIGDEALEWNDAYESAIESDDESWPSQSDTTERPYRRSDRTRRDSILQAIFEGKPRKHKDLGEWKPVPLPPSLSQPNIQVAHSRTSSTASSEIRPSRPMTASSGAEAALAAVHRSSPPASQGGRIRSPSRGSAGMGERPTFPTRSPNSQLSPLASEFAPSDQFVRPSSSSPSRAHSRHPSSSPRMVQALLTNRAQASRTDLPPIRIEQLSLAYPSSSATRPAATTATTTRPPYSSSIGSTYLPSGYTSLPMSRNTSKESNATIAAAVNRAQFQVGSVPLRTFSEPELHDMDAQMYTLNCLENAAFAPIPASAAERTQDRRQRQNLAFGRMDEWAAATQSPTTPVFPMSSFADDFGEDSEAEPGAVRFGVMEPVSIEDARRRANADRERSVERAQQLKTRAQGYRKVGNEDVGDVFGLRIDESEGEEMGMGKGKGKARDKENIPLR